MIKFLTRNPLAIGIQKGFKMVSGWTAKIGERGDRRGLALKGLMLIMAIGLGLIFNNSLEEYREASAAAGSAVPTEAAIQAPSMLPLVWQGIGGFLMLMAFLTSLWINERMDEERRGGFVVLVFWIAAIAGIVSWLPIDVLATKHAIAGKALAGETPSIPAYLGKIFLITAAILSIPASAMIYFRLSIMDRYVVHSFLSPLSFCLFSFIAIWLIADISDNSAAFTGLPITRMMTFYVVQIPFVIVFVMPIVVLLSALSALSKLSKSNEFISMVSAGRSVFRILLPVFVIGAYSSLICLALKYDWAPTSEGDKDAIQNTAHAESIALRQGKELIRDVWAKRGWMHVNEVDQRTWFVGKVPRELDKEMAEVVIWQLRENNQPETIWKARRAQWIWNSEPPIWVLTDVNVYQYDEEQIPLVTKSDRLEVTDWSETPWKVLSSSQDPEFLGVPGLSMYLNAHAESSARSLAGFRTNWWNIFAEPMSCLTLVLVAAPLGIVYSRRGAMSGVAGAIIVVALMFVTQSSMIALGVRGSIPPFFAAWITNVVVAGVGMVLLWYRAQNRELPKFGELVEMAKDWIADLKTSRA